MKKMNKGFSLVELIIVIAIMAILAGALAPALIKYINKSRVSTDIQTANTIATAVQTGLANEAGFDACPDTINWEALSSYWGGDDFKDVVKSTVGGTNAPTVKSKKCIAKSAGTTGGGGTDFYIYVDKGTNVVKVALTSGGTHIAYPDAVECLTNEAFAQCAQ